MRVVAIIPARYHSSRFPGKPLADLCGKPMIWWVYNQVKKVSEIDEVYVATDDKRIEEVCNKQRINVVMTRDDHGTSTERVNEVAHKVDADLYIVINGDEPLIDPEIIRAIIPTDEMTRKFYDLQKLLTLLILRLLQMKKKMHCLCLGVQYRIQKHLLSINIISMLVFFVIVNQR